MVEKLSDLIAIKTSEKIELTELPKNIGNIALDAVHDEKRINGTNPDPNNANWYQDNLVAG